MAGAFETLEARLTSDVSSFTRGMSDAGKAVGGLTRKAGDARKAIAGIGLAMGGLAVGGLAKSVSEAADFESAMAEVEKVTDPQTAAEMGDAIQDMAGEMPLAHKELATIAEQAGRLGVSGTKDISQYTETVARMAVATDLTAEEAGDAFARIGTLMDIPIGESENLGAAMNALSNNMGTSASEITDVMVRAGGSFNQLGIGEDSALALAGAMNEVSPSSRLAAGGLKRMAESMMDPSKVGAFAGALGVTEDEFIAMKREDPSGTLLAVAEAAAESEDASNLLKSELGKAGQEFATLGQNTDAARDAQVLASDAWREGTSLQEEFDAQADTLNSQIQILKNRLGNMAITIGEALLPSMRTAVDILGGMFDAFAKLDSMVGVNLGALALAAVAIAGLGTAAVIAAPLIAGIALAAAPVVGALLGIAAVVGILYVAWQENLFGIRDITQAVVSVLVGIFQRLAAQTRIALDIVADVFNRVFTFIRDVVIAPFVASLRELWDVHMEKTVRNTVEALSTIRDFFAAILNKIILPIVEVFVAVVVSKWEKFGDELMAIAEFVWGIIALIFEQTLDFLLTILNVFLNIISGDWEEAWDDIAGFFERTVERILDFAGEWGGRFLDWLGGLIGDIIQWFKDLASDLIGGSVIPDMFNDIFSFVTDMMGKILAKIEEVLNLIFGAFNNILSDIVGTVLGKMGEAKSGFANAIGAIKDKATEVLGKIVGAFRGAFNKVKDIASNIIGRARSAASKARSILGGVKDKVTGTARGAVTSTRDRLGSFAGAFQHGGIVDEQVLGLLGEAGPEAVVPLDKIEPLMATALADVGGTVPAAGGDDITEIDNSLTIESGAIQGVDDPKGVERAIEKWWRQKQRRL